MTRANLCTRDGCDNPAAYEHLSDLDALCPHHYRHLPRIEQAVYIRIDGTEETDPNLKAVDPTREMAAVREYRRDLMAGAVIVIGILLGLLLICFFTSFFGGR